MANQVLGQHREGDIRISSSGGLPLVEETYVFRVLMDSSTASRLEVLSVNGLPRVNQTVSAAGLATCKAVSAQRSEINPRLWLVRSEFSSEAEEGSEEQDPSTDPTAWIPVYETEFLQKSKVSHKDTADDVIANSAGQAFPDGITIGRTLPAWKFFQFEPATVTDTQIADRNESVNSATFRTREAKTLLLTVLSSKVGFYLGQRRRLTQYRLAYDPEKWTHKRYDVGTVYLEGGVLKPYTATENGVTTVISGPLDGAGAKVTAGDPPAVLEFDIYPSIAFADFLR